MKKNKIGLIAPTFLVMLIIGIFLFLFASSAIAGLFRLTNDSFESYQGLIQAISDIAKKQGSVAQEAFNLKLDKKTAIIIFSKDADEIKHSLILNTGKPGQAISVNRFTDCPKGKPCLCLCRKGLTYKRAEAARDLISCEKYMCYVFEQEKDFDVVNPNKTIDFKQKFDMKKEAGTATDIHYSVEGGFIFARLNYHSVLNMQKMNEISIKRDGREITIFSIKQPPFS